MSVSREPVPVVVYEEGVYLHGTKADLAVGDLLIPGRESARRPRARRLGRSCAEQLEAMRASLAALQRDDKAQIED